MERKARYLIVKNLFYFSARMKFFKRYKTIAAWWAL
jgi:hypothetical protein